MISLLYDLYKPRTFDQILFTQFVIESFCHFTIYRLISSLNKMLFNQICFLKQTVFKVLIRGLGQLSQALDTCNSNIDVMSIFELRLVPA